MYIQMQVAITTILTTDIIREGVRQACKPRSYASRNYDPPTRSLTGVRCRATNVAKKCLIPRRSVCWKACIVFKHIPTVEITTNIMLGKLLTPDIDKIGWQKPDIRHPLCSWWGVWFFDQIPKVFLMPCPPSMVTGYESGRDDHIILLLVTIPMLL